MRLVFSAHRDNLIQTALPDRPLQSGTRFMSTIVLEDTVVRIPPWVVDLASFRRWTEMDEFPETGRICYLACEVWVDMSTEQLFTHNQVQNEYGFTLTGLIKAQRRGRCYPDGAY